MKIFPTKQEEMITTAILSFSSGLLIGLGVYIFWGTPVHKNISIQPEVLTTIIGVLLGFAISELKNMFASKRRVKTNFKAIKAEIEYCSHIANEFLRAGVKAPLYRFPTKAYEASLPQLLSDSEIEPEELKSIQQFYTEVESVNRGLDQSEAHRENDERLEKEFTRNKLKAKRLVVEGENGISYYTAVLQRLEKRCS